MFSLIIHDKLILFVRFIHHSISFILYKLWPFWVMVPSSCDDGEQTTSVFVSAFCFCLQPNNVFAVLQRLGPLSCSSLSRRSAALQLWPVRLHGDHLWSSWRTVSLQGSRHWSPVHKVRHRILRFPLLQAWVNGHVFLFGLQWESFPVSRVY